MNNQPSPCLGTSRVRASHRHERHGAGLSLLRRVSINIRMNCHCVVVNKEVLGEDFVPAGSLGRDVEAECVLECLSPALKGRKPLHVWIHGDSGTGKTASARFVLSELKNKHGVMGAYVCCWQHRSLYKVVDALVEELRILRAEQQDTAFKLNRLEKHLDGKPFLVVLDEIDKVAPKDRNEILYGLCNLGQVGLVCVSSKKDAFFSLEAGVRSRLSPQFVECSKYSVPELTRILHDRAEAALELGSCPDSVCQEIARLSQGDARIAIQTLRSAAEWAEQDRKSCIEFTHVRRIWISINQQPKNGILDSLTEDHRMLYDIVRQQGRITSTDLRETYSKQCKKAETKPIAVRTFSKYLGCLIHSGLVTAEHARLKGKGRLLSICN